MTDDERKQKLDALLIRQDVRDSFAAIFRSMKLREQDVQEGVQEVCARAYAKIKKIPLEDEGQALAYLRSMAHNHACDIVKQQGRTPLAYDPMERISVEPGKGILAPVEAPRDSIAPENRVDMQREAKRLEARHKGFVWVLRRLVLGETSEQTAAATGKGATYVRRKQAQVFRALGVVGLGVVILVVVKVPRNPDGTPWHKSDDETVASVAMKLRTHGRQACDRHDWATCDNDLEMARLRDPAGESAELRQLREMAHQQGTAPDYMTPEQREVTPRSQWNPAPPQMMGSPPHNPRPRHRHGGPDEWRGFVE